MHQVQFVLPILLTGAQSNFQGPAHYEDGVLPTVPPLKGDVRQQQKHYTERKVNPLGEK